ncbi:MAG: hypothetical protein M1828_005337 [Chrysothrix sp. TS-e1954]|nr:MAG: hypothetical protein M1828_005337 [Chrysothrix sp. TS-e1954]
MSMITATAWVPRGHAQQFPIKYEITDEEYDRISKLAQLELDEARDDLKEAQAGEEERKTNGSNGVTASNTNGEIDDNLKAYDLEHYDDDEDEDDNIEVDEGDDEDDDDNVYGGSAYLSQNGQDPYITLKNDEEDEEEREELQILATDNLVLAARVEDEVAHLEVYVYEDEADNLYVHHDVMLPAIPLAVEWLNYAVGDESETGDTGNVAAVGTMEPDIELWNLDVVDCMFPDAILGAGGQDDGSSERPKKKKKRSRKPRDDYHVDAVLALAANRQHRNLLASASADKTVKLWDLSTAKCAKSYSYHTDKVCALAWHPTESTAMLSGSYDRTIVAGDMRAPDQGLRRWHVESDVENVRWDPHDSNYFYVSTESGILHRFDARTAPPSNESPSPAIWRLQAHDSALSSFDVNPIIPGFIVTGSDDKTVKIWNVEPPKGPSMVVSRDLGVGRVFSTNFAPDKAVGFRLAVAGSKGNLQIWDTSTNPAIRRTFHGRYSRYDEMKDVQDKLVGVQLDDSEESDDDDVEVADAGSDDD